MAQTIKKTVREVVHEMKNITMNVMKSGAYLYPFRVNHLDISVILRVTFLLNFFYIIFWGRIAL